VGFSNTEAVFFLGALVRSAISFFLLQRSLPLMLVAIAFAAKRCPEVLPAAARPFLGASTSFSPFLRIFQPVLPETFASAPGEGYQALSLIV